MVRYSAVDGDEHVIWSFVLNLKDVREGDADGEEEYLSSKR